MQINELKKSFIECHSKYKLIDISLDFYSIIRKTQICFILNNEKDKAYFKEHYFEECKRDFLNLLNDSELIDSKTNLFNVLSKEEIDIKYGGSIQYALK